MSKERQSSITKLLSKRVAAAPESLAAARRRHPLKTVPVTVWDQTRPGCATDAAGLHGARSVWSCTVNIFTAQIMLASCQSPQLSAQHRPLAGRATKSSERARKPRAQECICYHSVQTLQSESLLYTFEMKDHSNITQKNEIKNVFNIKCNTFKHSFIITVCFI